MTTPYRGRAPRVNPEDAPIPVPRSMRINVETLTGPIDDRNIRESGEIPTEGLRSVAKWAERFGVTERTVERWIREFRIPHVKVGRCVLVWADHLLPRLPLVTFPATEVDDESEA